MAVSRLLGESTGLPTLLPKASSAARAVPPCPTPSLIPAMHEGRTCAHCTLQRSPAKTVLCSSCSSCTTRFWDLRKCPKSQSDLQAKLSIRHAKLTHYRDVVLEAVMSMRLALVRGCTDGWMCFYDTTRGSASSQPTIGGNGKQISSGRSSTQVLRTRTRKLWLTCHLSSGCGTSSSRAASTGFLARAAVCSSRNCNASRMMPTS